MRVTSGNDVIEVEVDFIPPSQDTFYSPIKEFEIGWLEKEGKDVNTFRRNLAWG